MHHIFEIFPLTKNKKLKNNFNRYTSERLNVPHVCCIVGLTVFIAKQQVTRWIDQSTLYVYEYIKKDNETIHLENILTRNTAQLGYSGIIQYNSMHE